MMVSAGVLALLYFGLRYESDIGSFCTVCASERTLRQRGFALSETQRLWNGAVSEKVVESEVAKRYLETDHVHNWETWSNLYIALNGRSGGHPGVRMNPAAKAWRFNPKFRSAIADFAAEASSNLPMVRVFFTLPARLDGRSPGREEPPEALKMCASLLQDCGERVPEDWMRRLPR